MNGWKKTTTSFNERRWRVTRFPIFPISAKELNIANKITISLSNTDDVSYRARKGSFKTAACQLCKSCQFSLLVWAWVSLSPNNTVVFHNLCGFSISNKACCNKLPRDKWSVASHSKVKFIPTKVHFVYCPRQSRAAALLRVVGAVGPGLGLFFLLCFCHNLNIWILPRISPRPRTSSGWTLCLLGFKLTVHKSRNTIQTVHRCISEHITLIYYGIPFKSSLFWPPCFDYTWRLLAHFQNEAQTRAVFSHVSASALFEKPCVTVVG